MKLATQWFSAVAEAVKQKRKALVTLSMLVLGLVVAVEPTFAFTAPASTTLAYDIYDILFNKALNGPIGWVVAGGIVVFGVTQVMKQWTITLFCLAAATLMVKLGSIMTALGYTV